MADNNEMEIIQLTDEDGSVIDFEFLGTVEFNGNEYYALVPLQDNEECAYVILRAEDAGNGEVNLVTIEDDEEYDQVADLIEDELFSEIDYDDMSGNE